MDTHGCPSGKIAVRSGRSFSYGKKTEVFNRGEDQGGSIELDERGDDAMIREIQEEIGLKVLEYKFLNIYSGPEYHNIYPNGDEVSFIDIVYYCHKFEGEIALQEDEVKNIQCLIRIIYRPTLDETQRNG